MVADADGAGALPLRYVCHVCGECIATSDGLLETKDDAVAFSQLYGVAGSDKANKTVACPCCEQPLGFRANNSFLLRRERVVKGLEKLEILVCGLKTQELQEISSVLVGVFPSSNVTQKVLQKAELRGYQIQALGRPGPDFVVVVHRNEGRTLLTDRNGFYHDVLGSAWQLTRGNVLVVLTRTEVKADSAELYDEKLLRSLATQGDQPTIGAIGALGRVLTWESAPSKPQLAQLRALTSKAYFREASPAAQGLPAAWVVRPSHKASSAPTWCSLL